MQEVSKESSKNVGDDGIKPEEVVILKDNASEKSINKKIKKRKNNANNGEFASTLCKISHILIIPS